MNFFTPKSYRIKHKILEFLSKERMKNGGLNPKETWKFTIKQICKNIKEDFDDVNSQLDYLFYKKLIQCDKNESEPTNPFCWALDEGVEVYSSHSFINDGKLLQSTLFNNLSTGFFQIIVRIIAVVTIAFNYLDSKLYHEEVKNLSKEIERLQTDLSKKVRRTLTENDFIYTKQDYQTKSQIYDNTIDSVLAEKK